jgi:hypothetical protein
MKNYQLLRTAKGNHTIIFSGQTEIRIHSAYDPVTNPGARPNPFQKEERHCWWYPASDLAITLTP